MTERSQKLTVAMVGEYPLDGKFDGGVQTVTANLASGICKYDHIDLHVLTYSSSGESFSCRKNGYFLHVLPKQRLGFSTLFRIDRAKTNRLFSRIRPDIVHSQGTGRLGYVSLKTGLPSVLTIHGLFREHARSAGFSVDKYRLLLNSCHFERYCIQNAPNMIFISSFAESYFQKSFHGNGFHVPNPVSRDFFSLTSNEQGLRVVYAGKIIPPKGVKDLISAFSQIDRMDASLVLCGSEPDPSYSGLLRKMIADTGMEKKIRFLGLLSERKLLKEYERSSLLVHPSYQENSPMVIQQAMAAGKPVIATRTGGVPGLVSHAETGFLYEMGDVPRLKEYLSLLLKKDELRRDLGRNARKKAFSEFHPDIVSEKTLQVYESVAGDRERRYV